MLGEKIVFTSLFQCQYCSVQRTEGTPFGAAFDASQHRPGFFDLLGASFSGYEPRNGVRQLTTCSCFEQCGVENPRQAICFLYQKAADTGTGSNLANPFIWQSPFFPYGG